MLELILSHDAWTEFFTYKKEKNLLNKYEEKVLSAFIEKKRYVDIGEKIVNGTYTFSPPFRREINKMGSSKKRVVFTYPEEENVILKFIAYLLYEYENKICENSFAFRRDTGAKAAFCHIKRSHVDSMYCFKTDIHDYFNSIDVNILIPIIHEVVDDKDMASLLADILSDNRCVTETGEIITVTKKGAMAGTPISAFLANIYLREADRYFCDNHVIYARYSDDIVIFDTEEKIQGHIDTLHEFFAKYNLTVNPEKETLVCPHEEWTFLGFSYCDGKIDIAGSSVKKIMAKMKRASHKLYRWKLRKNASDERTVKAYIRKFDRKFYSSEGDSLCWSRWYFPIINSDEKLHIIDKYMQECMRYLATGRHSKVNYAKVPYDTLKKWGYTTLVNKFHEFKNKKQ